MMDRRKFCKLLGLGALTVVVPSAPQPRFDHTNISYRAGSYGNRNGAAAAALAKSFRQTEKEAAGIAMGRVFGQYGITQ